MLNFPEVSMIRFPKLIIHSILLVVVLTLIALSGSDIAGWILGRPIESSIGLVPLLVLIWAFFALQSKKYKKQETQ